MKNIAFGALAYFITLWLATCHPRVEFTPSPEPQRLAAFDGQNALALLQAQLGFGFRPSGSDAGWATGDWILSQLGAAGWEVDTQEFPYRGVTVRNIIGRMPKSDDEPVILLGAHYDTRKAADQDTEYPDQPVMGANDGASGTAVLLELAYALEPDKIPYQVWLIFFDAEDNGNLEGWNWIVGSSYMAAHLSIRPAFVIVVDMIGDKDQQIYYEWNSDPGLMESIWQTAAGLGFGDIFIPEYSHTMLDDHTPFARLGIPSVVIIDFDYPYWHTTSDTADKVSGVSLMRVGKTVETFLETKTWSGESNERTP